MILILIIDFILWLVYSSLIDDESPGTWLVTASPSHFKLRTTLQKPVRLVILLSSLSLMSHFNFAYLAWGTEDRGYLAMLPGRCITAAHLLTFTHILPPYHPLNPHDWCSLPFWEHVGCCCMSTSCNMGLNCCWGSWKNDFNHPYIPAALNAHVSHGLSNASCMSVLLPWVLPLTILLSTHTPPPWIHREWHR